MRRTRWWTARRQTRMKVIRWASLLPAERRLGTVDFFSGGEDDLVVVNTSRTSFHSNWLPVYVHFL